MAEPINGSRRGTPDFLLLFLTFLLVGFGLVMVFSASSMIAVTSSEFSNDAWYFTKRQIMFAFVGTIAMLVLMNIPYSALKKWFVPFFMMTVTLLVLVLIAGQNYNGAKSWFGFGSFGIQPSEAAKLGIIVYLSVLIQKKGEKIRDFQKGLLPILVVLGFVCLLIMLQPDLGSCMILLLSALLVAMVGGVSLKQLFAVGAIVGAVGTLMLSVYLMTAEQYGYRLERITSFLDPWNEVHMQDSSWQLVQSLFAIGHGGLTGTGIGQSIQKLHYLPEAYSDFIFAIIGEELGFLGTVLFLGVYIAFIWRGLIVAMRSPDISGNLVGVGIIGMIGIQALINIGGVTGSIPITGVTLPFISHGGSSLLMTMFSMGLLLSISREASRLDPVPKTSRGALPDKQVASYNKKGMRRI